MKKLLTLIVLIGIIVINVKTAQATSCDETNCTGTVTTACQDPNNPQGKPLGQTYTCPPPKGAQGATDASGDYQASNSTQCMTYTIPKTDPCVPGDVAECGQFMILNNGASE
jgi:hypothetical protein